MTLNLEVPEGSQAVVHIPKGHRQVSINGEKVVKNGRAIKGSGFQLLDPKEMEKGIEIPQGEFTIIAN